MGKRKQITNQNRAKKQKRADDVANSSPCTTPLHEDILNIVSHFLRFKDLKNYRLVSKLWNTALTPELRRRAKITLICNFTQEQISRNAKFFKEMKTWRGYTGCANFGSLCKASATNTEVSPPKSIVTKNTSIFAKKLQFQQIEATLRTNWEMELLQKVLLNSTGILQMFSFTIAAYPDQPISPEAVEFWSTHTFPKVTKVEVRMDGHRQWASSFFEHFLQAFPNVRQLSATLGGISALFCMPASVNRMRNITDLKVMLYSGPHTRGKCLQLLSKFPGALKKLSLTFIHISDQPIADNPNESDVSLLRDFLSQQSRSLERIQLLILKYDGTRDIEIPRFPELKRLQVYIMQTNCNFTFEQPDQDGVYGDIDYSYNFPKLQTFLSRDLARSEGLTGNSFRSWFPLNIEDKKNICQSLKHFEFYQSDTVDKLDSGKLEIDYFRLPKLFPNADNAYMQEIKTCTRIESDRAMRQRNRWLKIN